MAIEYLCVATDPLESANKIQNIVIYGLERQLCLQASHIVILLLKYNFFS